MSSVVMGVVVALVLMFVGFLAIFGIVIAYLMWKDVHQEQHSILRSHPVLGRFRYLAEKVSPEIRQYFTDGTDKQPFAPDDFKTVAKASKYISTVESFGSDRDYEAGGFFLKNAMFPKLESELAKDKEIEEVATKKYVIDKEGVFSRDEHVEDVLHNRYLLKDEDAVVIGRETCANPFVVKSVFGMSAMSFGSLGANAVTTLSMGLGKVGGSWMNTGEGGLSEYHLKGGVDIICQIGPAKFGFRDADGGFSMEKFVEKASIPEVKAFEIKMGQGAKIRGGKILAAKVTPEVAAIRGVEPWKDIDSPNRFDEFANEEELLYFVKKLRDASQKPIGIKIVVGGLDSLDGLVRAMLETGIVPDFITVDGSEGGTGAADRAMMQSIGLPLKPALILLNKKLKDAGLRERTVVIASGKLIHSDRIAVALGLGADLVNVARGFLVSVGCVGAQICASGGCPAGITTHDPDLQKALVIDEKKYRVTNYVLAMRKELYALGAACGIDAPSKFTEDHVVYVDGSGEMVSLEDLALRGDVTRESVKPVI